MGREAKVEYAQGAERAIVRAHLDSEKLELTGGKKLTVPLAGIKAAVDGDRLKITAGKTTFALALGAKEAEAWRKKMLSPPTLADKLGFKPGKSVLLIGALPAEVAAAAKSAATAAKLPKAIAADIAALMLTPGNLSARRPRCSPPHRPSGSSMRRAGP